jgi:hypothetical protein
MDQFLLDTGNYPLAAVEHMIDEWGRTGKALPVLAETEGLIQAYMAQNTNFKYCGNCDTGWIYSGSDSKGNAAVKRCACTQV